MKQFNVRLPEVTIKRIKRLAALYGSQAKAIIAAVESLYKEIEMSSPKMSFAAAVEYISHATGAEHTEDEIEIVHAATVQAIGSKLLESGVAREALFGALDAYMSTPEGGMLSTAVRNAAKPDQHDQQADVERLGHEQCPKCGAWVTPIPDTFDPRDGVCPNCGALLWDGS